jgi:hypothetical protein
VEEDPPGELSIDPELTSGSCGQPQGLEPRDKVALGRLSDPATVRDTELAPDRFRNFWRS